MQDNFLTSWSHNIGKWRTAFAMSLCACMSLFHLYTSGVELLRQPIQRAVHVGFTLVIIYLLFPLKGRFAWIIDVAMLVVSTIGTAYIAMNTDAIALRGGAILGYEVVLGALTIVAVLEAARRVLGKALPLLAVFFLIYCYYGIYAPGFLQIRGYSVERIVQHMYLGTEGIFGVAVGVSSTYIFLFILFGSFLVAGGGAQFFNNISLALAGRFTGGPAKVVVLTSGLMGTINGSSIANAATVGTLTIPMMKKVGYSAEEAAGIEACASTGGQLMPPIMGAAAFIMAEFLRMPYQSIALAAFLPAVLYYLSIFVHVHFIAKRDHVKGIQATQGVLQILRKDGYLLLPIAVAVTMLIMNYTPMRAAFWAIITMIALSVFSNKDMLKPQNMYDVLGSGAKNALSTAIACTVVGFVVGTSSLTALGMSLSGNIVDLTGGHLLLTLVVCMFACLIFGMGLPTTANYIVTSAILAPVLMQLGIPGIAAHLFVFYFGIKADITPPVCLATLTAAGIAQANTMKSAFIALSMALPSFLLPYLFVYSPEILLQGSVLKSALLFCSALCGIVGITAFMTRWLGQNIGMIPRVLCLIAGFLCYFPQESYKFSGMAGIICLTAFYAVRTKKHTKSLKL